MSDRVITQSFCYKTCCERLLATCCRTSTCCNSSSTGSSSTQTNSNRIGSTCSRIFTNSYSIITSCSRLITNRNCRRTRSIRWFTYGNSSLTRCFWSRTKSKRLATTSICLLTNSYVHIFAWCCFCTDRNRVNRLISCTKTNCNTIFLNCFCIFTNSYCFIASTSRTRTNRNCVMRDYIVTVVSVSVCASTDIDIANTLIGTNDIPDIIWFNGNRTSRCFHTCLSSAWSHQSTCRRNCSSYGFTLVGSGFFAVCMADFRNRGPCLGRVVPNDFKDFIHIDFPVRGLISFGTCCSAVNCLSTHLPHFRVSPLCGFMP